MFLNKAKIQRVDNKLWKVLEDIVFEGRDHNFVVPKDFVTDLASIPKLFRSIFNTYGSYTEAAILHDLLSQLDRAYRKGELAVKNGTVEFKEMKLPQFLLVGAHDVDGIFRKAMKDSGTNFLGRWYMWGATRIGSLFQGRVGSVPWFSWVQLIGLAAPFVGVVAGLVKLF